MKHFFGVLLACIFVFGVVITSTTNASAAPAHDSINSRAACGTYTMKIYNNINDQGTGTTIGNLQLWTDGCGNATAYCWAFVGVINHCELENTYGWIWSGPTGHTSSEVSASGDAFEAIGVVQAINLNYWGGVTNGYFW